MRYRVKPVALRSASRGRRTPCWPSRPLPRMTDPFGVDEREWLAAPLEPVYRDQVDLLVRLIDEYNRQITLPP